MDDQPASGLWATALAAALVGVCCIGPILLTSLGLSVAAIAGFATSAWPYLLGVGAVLAGAGLYFARQRRSRQGDDRASTTLTGKAL